MSDNNDVQTIEDLWDEIVEGKTEEEPTPDQEGEVVTEEGNTPTEDNQPIEESNEGEIPPEEPEQNQQLTEGDEDSSKKDEIKGNFLDDLLSKGLTEEEKQYVLNLNTNLTELQKQNQLLHHKASSDAGRVSALAKKVNRLQQEGGGSPALKDNPADLDKFIEEYPELSKGMMALAKQQAQQELSQYQSQVDSRLEVMEQGANQTAVERQAQELDQLIPNWRQVAGDPNFQSWLYTQPESIQGMATSLNNQEVVYAINLYTQYLDTTFPQQPSQPQQPTLDQEQPPQEPVKQRQKTADVTPAKAGAVTPNTSGLEESGSYEDMFDAAVSARLRNKKRSNY